MRIRPVSEVGSADNKWCSNVRCWPLLDEKQRSSTRRLLGADRKRRMCGQIEVDDRPYGSRSPGVPKGNKNAFKHGRYFAEAVARRRLISRLKKSGSQPCAMRMSANDPTRAWDIRNRSRSLSKKGHLAGGTWRPGSAWPSARDAQALPKCTSCAMSLLVLSGSSKAAQMLIAAQTET